MRTRKIIGVQVHHSVNLDDAARYGANMLTALDAALAKTGTDSEHGNEIRAMQAALAPAVRQVSGLRALAQMRLQLHQSDDDFKRYVEGDLPYPDESTDGFEARCRCGDQCLVHDHGVGAAPADCNCGVVCEQHR